MFEAIFWDNDGVLMDTEHLYFRANVEALADIGIDLPVEDFLEISLRRGQSVLVAAGDREPEVRRRRDARYRALLAAEAKAMPEAAETLARLHGRIPMAIVTSCRRENFLNMHRASGLLGFFDFVLTREDYSLSKPHPEPYLAACSRAGISPSRCLAVEDSERGVTAASLAGLTVAAVPGALNGTGNFSAARWRLESIAEIPTLLGL